MEDNQYSPYKSNGRFWTGAFFLICGGLLLASKMGAPIPDWVFSWEAGLIALGLFIGAKHRFQNGGWIAMVCVGTFFLLDERIADVRLHEYIWPVMIIFLGVYFIVFPKNRCFNRRRGWRKMRFNKGLQEEFGYANGNTPDGINEEDTLFINSVFSGIERNILSKNFKGGEITCIFGGVELDFMQADIQGIAVLRLEQVFGGIELRVPANWTIRNEIDGAFHGMEDKRRFPDTTDANKVLVLKGNAVFAGIEIKSY